MTHHTHHLFHRDTHNDQPHHPEHSGARIALGKITPIQGETLIVTSPAIDLEGRIDPAYSADERGPSPQIEWSPVEGAGAFALIVEDPDAPQDEPYVHWLIWNIPAESLGLPKGVAHETPLMTPQHAVQAKNDSGTIGWFGPKPPAGHGVHHYHFQLFALDGPLTLHPLETDVRILTDAIKGRTVASGEVVGTFEVKDTAPGEG